MYFITTVAAELRQREFGLSRSSPVIWGGRDRAEPPETEVDPGFPRAVTGGFLDYFTSYLCLAVLLQAQ